MANAVPTYPPPAPPSRANIVSERVLISAVAILFFVVLVVLILHLYAHWHIRRARRRDARARRSRFVFHVGDFTTEPASQGLDPAVLESLPQFKRAADSDPIECAVCLSEVEEGESGRTLPKCCHSFHTGCIDMWFYSHSTCPLCRAAVELPPVEEPEPVSTSSGTSKGTRDICVSVEIPTRNGNPNFEDGSPAQVRSPVGRILSMILARERRSTTSAPASPTVGGCLAEVDLEDGMLKCQGVE